jgi:hypothetical protein
VDAGSLASKREIGAWEATNDEIHAASEGRCVESDNVREHRRRIQASLFHARCQDFDGKSFPLNESDDARVWKNESDGLLEAPDSREEPEDAEGGGMIHMAHEASLDDEAKNLTEANFFTPGKRTESRQDSAIRVRDTICKCYSNNNRNASNHRRNQEANRVTYRHRTSS